MQGFPHGDASRGLDVWHAAWRPRLLHDTQCALQRHAAHAHPALRCQRLTRRPPRLLAHVLHLLCCGPGTILASPHLCLLMLAQPGAFMSAALNGLNVTASPAFLFISNSTTFTFEFSAPRNTYGPLTPRPAPSYPILQGPSCLDLITAPSRILQPFPLFTRTLSSMTWTGQPSWVLAISAFTLLPYD